MSENSTKHANELYQAWLDDPAIDEKSKQELRDISSNPKEIEDRFYMDLQFGTAGLRGILGVGSNRMNSYVVARASQGYANTLLKMPDAKERGVAIAYDSRRSSDTFALEAALVLCGNGIHVYLSDDMRSVPQLSFAVGHYNCAGGIVITASHNPKQYNGYKVYAENGAQIDPNLAEKITASIMAVPSFSSIKRMDEKTALSKGLLRYIGKEWDEAYFEYTKSLVIDPELFKTARDLPIVYTPLHGAGVKPVPRILSDLGLNNVKIVEEQAKRDPDFSTVSAPNPEAPDAFNLAIELADSAGASIVLATDPDVDRLGVAVKDADGRFKVLSGNQIATLIFNYRLQRQKELSTLPSNPIAVRSLVSSQMPDAIAKEYGVEMLEVLTGFRYVGEIVAESAKKGDRNFVFGFEESYGYLSGTKVRDKDAICAAMMMIETVLYYSQRNMSLLDGLEELYKKYAYYQDSIKNYVLYGKEGLERIQAAMQSLRDDPVCEICSVQVLASRDYKTQIRKSAESGEEKLSLPRSDVLYYELADGSWFCVRPSGTEPKLKVYISVCAKTSADAEKKCSEYMQAISARLDKLLS